MLETKAHILDHCTVIFIHYNEDYLELRIIFHPIVELFAASRINLATSFGWDTGDAWLDVTDIDVALICFANVRSASGGIA